MIITDHAPRRRARDRGERRHPGNGGQARPSANLKTTPPGVSHEPRADVGLSCLACLAFCGTYSPEKQQSLDIERRLWLLKLKKVKKVICVRKGSYQFLKGAAIRTYLYLFG